MAEELVVIRTFVDEFAADAALAELQAAGIQSLLFSDGPVGLHAHIALSNPEIGLAVHRRDVKLAEAVLVASPTNPA